MKTNRSRWIPLSAVAGALAAAGLPAAASLHPAAQPTTVDEDDLQLKADRARLRADERK